MRASVVSHESKGSSRNVCTWARDKKEDKKITTRGDADDNDSREAAHVIAVKVARV